MWITGFIVCLGWIFSLCFHEFSHALVAYWGGDTSVKDKGYLTFNPIKYTEPGLSLIMPLVFILIGGIGLPGGAVYINDNLLRSRWWSSLVSAAGPCSSMLFALFLMMPFWVLNFTLEYELSNLNNYETDILFNIIFPSLGFLIYLEICSVIFNLLPIPPLDGYGIIRPWLSGRINEKLNKYSNYSYYFIFGLFLFVPEFSSFFFGIIKNICHLFNISYPAISLGRQLFYQPINKFIAIIIILIIAYLLRLNENTWYKKGNSLARQKKDEQALVAYEKAIQIKPNYADAWLEKGHSLNRLQRYPEAVNSYQEVIKIDPSSDEAWLYLGHISFNAGNYEEAVKAYQKVINLKSNKNVDQIFLHFSQALLNLNRQEEAIAVLEEGIIINPQEYRLWITKASYLYYLKKYQEVIDCCQKAIAIHPQNTKLWYYLGISLQQLERYQEAKDVFEKIIAFDSQNILALSGQAHLYYLQQNYTAAINNYQKITEIEPDNDDAWYNMACCYSLQTKSQEAIVALQQAININPQQAIESAKKDADFAFLQSDQSFQNLVNE